MKVMTTAGNEIKSTFRFNLRYNIRNAKIIGTDAVTEKVLDRFISIKYL